MKLGDRIGPYQVLAKLGEGGMGEVWKARDTRLDRTVALKVSKADLHQYSDDLLSNPPVLAVDDVIAPGAVG